MVDGLSRLRGGDLGTAAERLDAALLNIESLYTDTESARRVRSLWYEEGAKAFKGEPYERASAFLFRGYLHLMNGQYDDARAAFKAGMLQDAFAEEGQYRCDFGALLYLYACASVWLGEPQNAEEAMIEAASLPNRAWFHSYEVPEDVVGLILVETGKAPRKVSDGSGHSELKYRRGLDFVEVDVEASCADGSMQRLPVAAGEDLYFQASTRGGRAVDRILDGKVVFRDSAVQVGSTAENASRAASGASAATGSGSLGVVGGVIGLIGGAARLVAANAKPNADTRSWSNLPDRVHIIPVGSGGGCKTVVVDFLDDSGQRIVGFTRVLTLPDVRPFAIFVAKPSAEAIAP